ncbi:MAG: hypothetical protein Q9218_000308 [Villophora microphyllina]
MPRQRRHRGGHGAGIRRNPAEDSRGLVDPQDDPGSYGDEYGPLDEEEMMYGPPCERGGGGRRGRGGHGQGPSHGGGGQQYQQQYGVWHRIMFEAFGEFNCLGDGCFPGGPCDQHEKQFLMRMSQSMGYNGPAVARQVRQFLRPRYGELNASLMHYAAQKGIQANSAAEAIEMIEMQAMEAQRGRGGPAFGPPRRAGGHPRGAFRGGGYGMDYSY